MKNILIIGGSYFTGRIFIEELADHSEYKVYVVNRGNVLLKMEGVTEIVCDRHDLNKFADSVPSIDWEAVVDFCAYDQGDISSILTNLKGAVKKYIYISTTTVYKNSLSMPMTEDSEVITGPLPPQMGGDYAYKKLLLEEELKETCGTKNTAWVILRPGFIYGKYNYAPRESYFFNLIAKGEPVILPLNPQALYSMVSVWDIARILIACIENDDVNNRGFIVAADELVSYNRIIEVLENILGRKLNVQRQTARYIDTQGIPLPFPLEDHLVYSGALLKGILNFTYMPFQEGMARTCKWFFKMK
jgi:2'-hydroxyisoflavone reductase